MSEEDFSSKKEGDAFLELTQQKIIEEIKTKSLRSFLVE
jgi:hypothetical protein